HQNMSQTPGDTADRKRPVARRSGGGAVFNRFGLGAGSRRVRQSCEHQCVPDRSAGRIAYFSGNLQPALHDLDRGTIAQGVQGRRRLAEIELPADKVRVIEPDIDSLQIGPYAPRPSPVAASDRALTCALTEKLQVYARDRFSFLVNY